MINIQNVEKYPENYDWLDITDQQRIIAYMNGMQRLAERYYAKAMTQESEEYMALYNHTLISLTGSKNAYATVNIMTEYSWKGHKYEWFLATREDAEIYAAAADEDDTLSDIDDLISNLLDYTDVGI